MLEKRTHVSKTWIMGLQERYMFLISILWVSSVISYNSAILGGEKSRREGSFRRICSGIWPEVRGESTHPGVDTIMPLKGIMEPLYADLFLVHPIESCKPDCHRPSQEACSWFLYEHIAWTATVAINAILDLAQVTWIVPCCTSACRERCYDCAIWSTKNRL